MSHNVHEIVRLSEGTLLFKGTRDPTDPMTTKSFFSEYGFGDNTFKWFTDDPHVAELYGGNAAKGESVWVYYLRQPTYIIRLYNNKDPTATSIALGLVSKLIETHKDEFIEYNETRKRSGQKDLDTMLMNPSGDIVSYLKLPFGMIPINEQSKIAQSQSIHIPMPHVENRNGEEYYLTQRIFQRYSYHTLDKYLMVFLNQFKDKLLQQYIDYKKFPANLSKQLEEFKQLGINGYGATSWNTIWHNGNFHNEICLLHTEYKDAASNNTPLIFVGRYILRTNPSTNTVTRKWVTLDGKELPCKDQIPFEQISKRAPEVRSKCMGFGGGSKKTFKTFKTFSGGNDVDYKSFGNPDPVPYDHFINVLPNEERERILQSMFPENVPTQDKENAMKIGGRRKTKKNKK